MAVKKVILLVSGLLLVLQFLTVAKAWPPSAVPEPWLPEPPLFPVDDPPAIPDSPFIESLTPKQLYNIWVWMLVTEAFCSSPGSCNWNPMADLNLDNVVNIYDAIIVSKNC